MVQDKARDLLIVGLRNPHGRANRACRSLSRGQKRLQQHMEETEQQMTRLKDCLRQCAESESTIKDTATSLIANMQAMMHSFAGDDILEITFANNTFEQFEIAEVSFLPRIGHRWSARTSARCLAAGPHVGERSRTSGTGKISLVMPLVLTEIARGISEGHRAVTLYGRFCTWAPSSIPSAGIEVYLLHAGVSLT